MQVRHAPLRAAIYTRVSVDRHASGRSVAEQEAECRRWVAAEGWDLVEVYSDNDRSASRYAKRQRPDWHRLTDDLQRNSIDVLVVWEISRATRDRLVWAALVDLCLQRGAKLCVGGKLHDLDDPDDAFALDLTSSLAVRESGVTRKRILRTTAANAAKGRPHGRVLFGYRRVYDDRTGELLAQVIRDDQALVVREAAERFALGEGFHAIAADFNRRGITTGTGSPWIAPTVRKMLTNPGYIGRRVHRGQEVGPATWPAILEEQLYFAVAARLADPLRRTMRDTTVAHLLSGIAVCGVCRRRLRVQKNRGYRSYMCVATGGFCVSIREEKLDEFVAVAMCDWAAKPDAAALWLQGAGAATAAVSRLEELRARLDGFYAAAAAGGISAAGLARVEAPLLEEIGELERQAGPTRMPPAVAELIGAGDVRERWERLTLGQQRSAVRGVVVPVVNRTRRGARTLEPGRVTLEWVTG